MQLSRLFRFNEARDAGGLGRQLLPVIAIGLIAAHPIGAQEGTDPIRPTQGEPVAADTEPADPESEPAPSTSSESSAPSESPAPSEPGGATGPPPGVEVMRVRGRGIATIATEVPDSVTHFDASTIQALGAQNVSDLSKVTPNVNIVQPGATQATFFVRGVGLSDFSSNAAGAVTIFQDGVSLNAPAIQTGSLFDIENVEIVRGPQGSGPFRNASAGAILVRSRRPTGNYGASLRSTIGRYDTSGDKGAVTALLQDYEGAIEMPIVEEWLSSRFAFRFRDAEPYKTNGCGDALPFALRQPRGSAPDDEVDICGERDQGIFNSGLFPNNERSRIPDGLPSEVGDQHNWAARATLRLRPPDTDIDLNLSFHGSRLDQDAALGQVIGVRPIGAGPPGSFFGGQTATGYRDADQTVEFEEICGARTSGGQCMLDPLAQATFGRILAEDRPLDRRPYRGDYNRVGNEERDAWGGFAAAEWIFADLEFSLLASYDTYERTTDQDTDFAADLLFEQLSKDEAWQTYEELSVGGELETQPFVWEIGGYYLHEELDFFGDTEIRLASRFERDYSQKIDSFGVWGSFEWDFLDDFTLGGGVRYNYEEKTFRYTVQQTQVFVPFPRLFDRQEKVWETPTGDLVLTYHVSDEVSTYAKYSRGFKAGHYNAIASQTVGDAPADPEFNDAWETGFRGSWFDSRLSLQGAFFYYRYEDYQIFLFQDRSRSPPALEIVNAKEAENYGVELEGSVRPLQGWVPRVIEGLALSANFGWLHGEYIDFSSFVEPAPLLRVPVDFSGNALQNSPEYKVSATAEWTLDFGRYGMVVPRYDVIWTDDVFFDASEGKGVAELKGVRALPEYALGQKAYFMHNVRLAYRTPTGNVELAAWIRNVEDTVYKNFAFDAASFQGLVINFPGEPRTYGLDLSVNFF